MGKIKEIWEDGFIPDDQSPDDLMTDGEGPGYFKEDRVDDWLVSRDEAKGKMINIGSFFRWLLDEHPEEDEIFNVLKESRPEWDELSSDDVISELLRVNDDIKGICSLCSFDMDSSQLECCDRLEKLVSDFLQVNLNMVKMLPNGTPTEREWNFREDNNQHFYGDIPYNQEVISLTLNWKPDSSSPSKLVGKYQINLPLLLKKGFVQEGSKGIKLRFQSTGDAIEIATDRNSPALRIGSKPEQEISG